jgi:dolichol-phosphate mannosyltransferase
MPFGHSKSTSQARLAPRRSWPAFTLLLAISPSKAFNGRAVPTLSVIIPTYNEEANVTHLADSLASILEGIDYELVFVDDSADSTPRILERLTLSNPRLRYLHRSQRGLGTAIVAGFGLASGDVLAVIDADFQHPPTLLPRMLAAIQQGADVVIPSRFIPGGDDGGLSIGRKLVSATARYIGKLALKALRPISDPTGGFIMFRASVIKGVRFRPLSWKVPAEVLVRGRYQKVIEIPYHFSPRRAGVSKLTGRETINYLLHVLHLVSDSPPDRRFFLFACVGGSGFLVDIGLYTLAIHFGAPVIISGFASALCAMVWNFTWNDLVTWRENHHIHISVRALKYAAISTVGIGISTSTLAFSYQFLHFAPLPAKLSGIALAIIWNYLLNSRWTWRAPISTKVMVTRQS